MIYELEYKPKGIVTCEVRRKGELISRTQGENVLTPRLKGVLAMLLGADRANPGVAGAGALTASSVASYMQVIFPDLNNAGRYSTVGSTAVVPYGRTTGSQPGAATTTVVSHTAVSPSTSKVRYQQVFQDIRMVAQGDKLAFRLYGGNVYGAANSSSGAGTETQAITLCNGDASGGTAQANTRRYLNYELWAEKIDIAPNVQIVEGDSVTCTYEIYPAMTLGSVIRPVVDGLLCTALTGGTQAACALTSVGTTTLNPPTTYEHLVPFAGTAKPVTNGGNALTFPDGDFAAAYTISNVPQYHTSGTSHSLGYTGTGSTGVFNYSNATDVLIGDTAGVVKAGIQKSINSLAAVPLGGYCKVTDTGTNFDNVVAYVSGALGATFPANANKRHSFQFRVLFS